MTISVGGGGNINPTPQVTFTEQVVNIQDELAKKGTLGLGNAPLLVKNTEDLSLLHMDRDSRFKYKSEAGRPSILPVGSFRSAGADLSSSGENIISKFNKLISELPLEMQEMIKEARDQDALVLKEVLQNASKMLDLQDRALEKSESNDAIIRAEANAQFPVVLFRNMARVGKDLIESAKVTIEQFTGNDPDYLSAKEMIGDLENLIGKAKLPERNAQ
ncbi:hypothetical protein PHSC3_001121 [Chlamydiales bacterium STE3]|nr:hypothetical protein PHSC3_001121 [Chlamydiales bacterium STE3]